MRVLVSGGAGYIGSIVTEQLIERNHQVIVFDNLCQGHADAIHPDAVFIPGDLSNPADISRAFDEYQVDAVMHFAAHSLVGESMQLPFKYIGDNVTNGLNLIRATVDHGVRRFVLSSTANLFGDLERVPIDENERIVPGSPYGESKHILERVLFWLDRTVGLHYAALRYFNAAGASRRFGEHHHPETHIIPIVLQVALGQRDHLEVFGNDYPTPDGTCIRDYIHVIDLAQAHILALSVLDQGSCTYNLGNGQGFSVLELVQMARKITDHPIPIEFGPRRPGDPAVLIASSDKIRQELGWNPAYADLRTIVETAWHWHRQHPNGYQH